MGSKLTRYHIKLGSNVSSVNGIEKTLWHVTSPDMSHGRIKMEDWKKFTQRLKSNFKKHRLNWEMYAKPNGTQPVYEYNCDIDDLKYVINDFITRELNGDPILEEFSYDKDGCFFNLHPEIASTYQVSSGSPFI